jgi:hypothetical protein
MATKKRKPAKRGRGRPTDCTPYRIRRVCEALRLGATWEMAAGYIRKSPSTLRKWLQRGRAGEQPFEKLLDACVFAIAEGGVECLRKMASGEKGSFLPNAWILERRFGYNKDGTLAIAQAQWLPDLDDESEASSGVEDEALSQFRGGNREVA